MTDQIPTTIDEVLAALDVIIADARASMPSRSPRLAPNPKKTSIT